MELYLRVLLCILLRFYTGPNTNVVCSSEINGVVNMNAISNFDEIKGRNTYVDTRGLIPALFESAAPRQFQLITTPHKFGKTTNLKMLKRFLEKSDSRCDHLFSGVHEDSRCSNHFGHYSAVIYVSFRINVGSTYEDIIEELGENIRKVFRSYEWLYEKLCERYHENYEESRMKSKLKFMRKVLDEQLDEKDIEVSLVELSKILFDYFDSEGVFLLIDDYDSPVITAIEQNLDTKRVMNFVNRIMNLLFNIESDYIQHAVITGTLDVLDKAEFALIKRYYFPDNDRLCRYFGFIETETETLLDRHLQNETVRIAVMQYYNGYTGYRAYNVRENIYNTFSIQSYLSSRRNEKGELNNYWAETNRIPNFLQNFYKGKPYRDVLLKVLEVKQVTFPLTSCWSMKDVEHMKNETHNPSIISLKTILESVTQSTDSYEFMKSRQLVSRILSYLYYHGFLTRTEEPDTYKIPNTEVETYLRQLCEKIDN